MSFKTDLNAGLSKANTNALKALGTTGHLPSGPAWSALERQRESNVGAFDRNHPLTAALLQREKLIDAGKIPLTTPVLAYLDNKADVYSRIADNLKRFTHYHPFLSRLARLTLPGTPGIPVIPVTPVEPVPPIGSVPEPASYMMMITAIILGLAAKKFHDMINKQPKPRQGIPLYVNNRN